MSECVCVFSHPVVLSTLITGTQPLSALVVFIQLLLYVFIHL